MRARQLAELTAFLVVNVGADPEGAGFPWALEVGIRKRREDGSVMTVVPSPAHK